MKKYVLPGLLGAAVSILCLLPPILHFVTGPLGPLIGGFVGGVKARVTFKEAVIVGGIIGLSLAVLFLVITSIILSLQLSIPGTMQKFVTSDSGSSATMLATALIPLFYGAVLGTIGAWLGGRVVNPGFYNKK